MMTVERARALCKTHNLSTNTMREPHTPQTIPKSELLILTERLEAKLRITPQPRQMVGARFRACEEHQMFKSQVLLYDGMYSKELCRLFPNLTFVFGDNNRRVGMGGQAIIRDEPNACGVSTKRSTAEYMGDSLADMSVVCSDLNKIEAGLNKGMTIVLHVTPEGRISLGCGLAELPYRSPLVYAFLEKWFADVCRRYKAVKIKSL